MKPATRVTIQTPVLAETAVPSSQRNVRLLSGADSGGTATL